MAFGQLSFYEILQTTNSNESGLTTEMNHTNIQKLEISACQVSVEVNQNKYFAVKYFLRSKESATLMDEMQLRVL